MSLPIEPGLLDILCCPETHQPLAEADAGLVERLNRGIQAAQVRTRAGALVQEPLEAGLVRRDGRFVYPVRGGIPVLLVDEAIPVPGAT